MNTQLLRNALWALCAGLCVTAGAEWPTYEQAGFRHTALIYSNMDRTKEEFKPMIAYFDRDGKVTSTKMFDTFLFLNQFVDGIRTEDGETTKAQWDKLLSIWFAPNQEVDALHRAAQELKAELGELPQPLQVVFCIPYPHPKVHNFGDVGTGQSLNFENSNDVLAAVTYLTQAVEERMKQYPLLKLQGFYWMSEKIGDDKENLLLVSDFLHKKNYKFLWIPWFKADNWNHWKEYGFDCAIMQSNYAFNSTLVGGTTRANQIDISAKLSKAHDMGVEIEFPYARGPAHLDLIRQTFDAGTRLGFQHAPTAYFFSFDFLEYRSPDPEIRSIYDLTCDYINGKDTTMKVFPEWEQSTVDGTLTLHCDLPDVRRVDQIDIFFDEAPQSFDHIWVKVAGRPDSRSEWQSLAWSLTPSVPISAGRDQCITIPVYAPAKELQLTIEGNRNQALKVRTVYTDFHSGKTVSKLTDRVYTSSLPMANRPYNDSPDGRKLLDGITSGDNNAFIGWNSCPYTIRFDFGENPPVIDEFSLSFYDNPDYAIQYPDQLLAFQTDLPTLKQLNGRLTSPPETLGFLANTVQPQRDGAKPNGQNATSTWKIDHPAAKRYLVINGNTFQGWTFLSEAEFYNGKQKIDPAAISYELLTPPSRQFDGHGDNGTMLTDGRCELNYGSIVRVPENTTATFTIRMADAPSLSKFRLVYAMPGSHWGRKVDAPKAASVQINNHAPISLVPDAGGNVEKNYESIQAVIPETPVELLTFTVTTGEHGAILSELLAD